MSSDARQFTIVLARIKSAQVRKKFLTHAHFLKLDPSLDFHKVLCMVSSNSGAPHPDVKVFSFLQCATFYEWSFALGARYMYVG